MTKEEQKQATDQLQTIVYAFNRDFEYWMKSTGCRAGFGWQYGGLDKSPKTLEILAIDQIVFRKPPPQSLGGIMKGLENVQREVEK